MAGGLPILLSIGGDARKIIESTESGIAYSGGNPQSFVSAIDSLALDDERDRMSANSLRAYDAHYSAEKVYGEMIEYIEAIARQGELVS